MKQFVCLCLLGFTLYPTLILALTLTWPPNTQPNVSYKLYYGSLSGTYTNAVDCGTNTTVSISTVPSANYYFALVAYSGADGIESDFSAETAYIPTINTIYHLTLRSSTNLIDWGTLTTFDVTNNLPQQFYNLTISK